MATNNSVNSPIVVSSLWTSNSSGTPTQSSYAWADYTPTVTLVGGAGNTVPQYSTNSGRNCKMGNVRFVDIYLTGDGGNEGAGTGTVNIALPGTASSSNQPQWFPCGYAHNATDYIIYGRIPGSGTTIQLGYFQLINTISTFSGADQNNTAREIRLKFFYEE